MTLDLTTREVSQRLKEVGFTARTNAFWTEDELLDENDCAYLDWVLVRTDSDYSGLLEGILYAYSASTLLTWINENHKKYNFEWSLDDDGIFVYIVGTIQGEGEYSAEFNGSWPDLFAEAIIWIKEKENK